MRQAITIIVFLMASCLSLTSYAWSLAPDDSSVSFISIKKNNIGESHKFNDISGRITDGIAEVTIMPDSVDSRVPIRDERMRDFLFETELYPTIDISSDVASALEGLIPGDSKTVQLEATVKMHGESIPIEISARINALSKSKMTVSTVQPVIIRAANFNMVEGILKLSSLVNNLTIAESIPVSFSLTFTKPI